MAFGVISWQCPLAALALVCATVAAGPIAQPPLRPATATSRAALSQPAGASGCRTITGVVRSWRGSTCGSILGFSDFDNLIPVASQDGRNVYVVGSHGVAIFARESDGRLTQLPAPSGCLTRAPVAGCSLLRGPPPEPAFLAAAALDPDEQTLYVGLDDWALVTLQRDPATGALTQPAGAAGCLNRTGAQSCAIARSGHARLWRIQDITVTRDGRNVYAIDNDHVLLAFTRDAASGQLRQLPGADGCLMRTHAPGCTRMNPAFSPSVMTEIDDGRELLVGLVEGCARNRCTTSADLVRLRRDATTGALRPVAGRRGCLGNRARGCIRARGLSDVWGLKASGDGRFAYAVTIAGTLVTLQRSDGRWHALSGRRGCRGDVAGCGPLRGVQSPVGIALADDGRSLYVGSSYDDGAVAAFGRNPATGELRQREGHAGCAQRRRSRSHCKRAQLSENPTELATSADGAWLYVGGSDQLAILALRR